MQTTKTLEEAGLVEDEEEEGSPLSYSLTNIISFSYFYQD
jgi:hypothetical protein